ncbi:MAG: hypothetical protein ACREH6_12850 [Geminicoccaceae bacterium]
MPFIGKGALVTWHDVTGDGEADYNRWHAHEHLAERVAIPGFRRGFRYVAIEGGPRYFVIYDVDDVSTLRSEAYVDRLDHPTPWTIKTASCLRNVSRTSCRVTASSGAGTGGFLLTLRLSPARGQDVILRHWLADQALPQLAKWPGLVGAALVEGDPAASQLETAEKRLRGHPDAIADWVILLEGYDSGALKTVRDGSLSAGNLRERGAGPAPQAGIYRLLHCLSGVDLTA